MFLNLLVSPSQNVEELETLCSDLTFLLNNINEFQPPCLVLLGDFNAKHSRWCSTDKNNKAGIVLENITSTAGNPFYKCFIILH